MGIAIEEGRVCARQWQDDCACGAMTETFACGTAAVVAPVGQVRSRSGDWQVGDGRPGPVMSRLRRGLLDVQYGAGPDPFGWMHKVC